MPLKHDNLSNEGLKLNGPKRLDINHARVLYISHGVKLNINHPKALDISLSVRLNSDPAVLFGTVGKPRLFPNNIDPWYDRQEVLFFPDQEESRAILTNLTNKKRHNYVPSIRKTPNPGNRGS
ncbi:MAG: hypothetical protein KAT56_05015 [Sedimentisphaerales bacterium]|nr:hypothetical protein [Sedimentisphaerales bacterium]